VTPAEVWQNWQENAAAQGQKVTAASTAMDGDTLTVTGITIERPSADGGSSALIGEMQFRDNGDGTVAIVMPDSFPVLISLPPVPGVEGAKASEMTLSVTMPEAKITASGVPASLSYQTEMPTLEIAADIKEDATAVNVVAKMTGVSSNYLIEAAEVGTNLIQDFSAKTLDLQISTTGAPEQDVNMTLTVADIGGAANMTGVPATGMADMEAALNAGMTMDLTASYGIGSFDVAGKDSGVPMKVNGALGGGTFALGFAANRFAYSALGKAISLNASGTDATSNEPFTFSAIFANTSSKLELAGANWSNIEDFNVALQMGLTFSGAFALGASSFDFAGGPPDRKTALTASIGGADTSFSMAAAQMDYDLGAKALKVTMASPDLPMPEASMDLTELALDFAMPLSKSDGPAPFNLLVKLADLSVAEGLWGMIDPGGMLPHDPATLIVDTKGTATLTADLIQEDTMPGGAPPGILNSLDLTQFLLKIAGAEVTALGAFTFDNSDMQTFPGIPAPTGKIDIKALGLNALTDKLVAMGLLPEDQAMQGRMMLSMFANTDPAKDEITSTLEFKDKGFYANGQKLQ
jgi:hypothetical protein